MTSTLLITAGVVLVVGVALAFVALVVVTRLLERILPATEQGEQRRRGAARAVAVFVVIVAIAAAISVLAPELLTDIPSRLLSYLPNVLVAVLLLWMGVVLANLLQQLVDTSASRIGVPNSGTLAKVVFWIVLGLAIILAADQLGIETAALQRLLLAVLVIAGVATALAIGLGGGTLAGSVIAGRYVEDRFATGERIAVGDYEGTIIDIGLSSTALRLSDGDTVELPHPYLLERPVRRIADAGDQPAVRRQRPGGNR